MNYRLFIAIDPPEVIASQIRSLCGGLDYVRWTASDQLHLTLRFIGVADGMLLKDICSSLSAVDSASFCINLSGVGFFTRRGVPEVLWTSPRKSDELKGLYNRISSALLDCGIARDNRKFSPHFTLGRIKRNSDERTARYMAANSAFESDDFEIAAFHLYSSHLHPDGAVHEKLATFPLSKKPVAPYNA